MLIHSSILFELEARGPLHIHGEGGVGGGGRGVLILFVPYLYLP